MQSLGKMRVLKYKYFGQVDFMEVLPRLTHFSRLSNCSKKSSPISHQIRIFMRNIFLAPKMKPFYREIQCLSYTVWLSQREVFLQYPLLPQFPSEKIILDKLKNFTQQLLNSDWLKKTYQIFRQFSKNVCKTPVFNYFLSSLLCTCPVSTCDLFWLVIGKPAVLHNEAPWIKNLSKKLREKSFSIDLSWNCCNFKQVGRINVSFDQSSLSCTIRATKNIQCLILVSTGGGAIFSSRCSRVFSIVNAKFGPILAILLRIYALFGVLLL